MNKFIVHFVLTKIPADTTRILYIIIIIVIVVVPERHIFAERSDRLRPTINML